MNAESRIKQMLEVLKTGKTICIATPLRAWTVSKATIEKFEAAGMSFFKASGNSIFMATGRQYVCIDYCKFTVLT